MKKEKPKKENWFKRIYLPWALKNRLYALVVSATAGLFLLGMITFLFRWLGCIFYFFAEGNRIQTSLSLLVLGLPTFLTLWFFRTHDTREQIETSQNILIKAEENMEIARKNIEIATENMEIARKNIEIATENTENTKKNIANQDFFDAMRMLTDDKLLSQEIAVQRLIGISLLFSNSDQKIKIFL